MSTPYRTEKDHLGESERESAALIAFGKWKSSVISRVMLVFALGGVVLAGVGYWLAQEFQFKHNDGIAMIHVNVGAAALPFIVMLFAGVTLGRRVVRLRTPAKLDELAKAYEVPADSLAKTVKATVVM